MMQRDYIIFKGIHCKALGVRMIKLPRETRPPVRKKEYTVPGRHGTLRITEAERPVYNTYTESMEGVLLPHADMDKVKEWLTGEGWLTASNRPDRAQWINIDETIAMETILRGFAHRKLKVTAAFQPLQYEKERSAFSLYAADWVQNPGNVESTPIITVIGTGSFTLRINGSAIMLTKIDGEITLDSDMGDAYNSSGLQNNKVQGELPVFVPGKNTIEWDGQILRLDIQPNWRWV